MYEYKFYKTPKGLKRKKILKVRWDAKLNKPVVIKTIRIEKDNG